MAYAENHCRGWRARWRDPDGNLRSASGFTSRWLAEEYGRDREQGRRLHFFTRDQLTDALTHLDVRVALTGPIAGMINAESMADAIIEALDERTAP